MATHGNLWATVYQAMILAQEHAKAMKVLPYFLNSTDRQFIQLPSFPLPLHPLSGSRRSRSLMRMVYICSVSEDSSSHQPSLFFQNGISTER